MIAKFRISMRPPAGQVGERLLALFRSADNATSTALLSRAAIEVDESLAPLLNTFYVNDVDDDGDDVDGDLFWLELGKLSVVERDLRVNGILYELANEKAPYPYVELFGEQVKTWLLALNCTDVQVSIRAKLSERAETNILSVCDDYDDGRLAVFLGAGVSRQLGLPLWGELLNLMADSCSRTKGVSSKVVARLKTRGPTEQARWLKRELGPGYADAVRQALYSNAYRRENSVSPVLKAVSKLKKLRAVCTYNYDDFLERQAGPKFCTVASARDRYSRKDIPVFHVHGFLPFVGSPRGELILSEEDYNGLANNATHWSNVVQINLFRECTCLLIGISCTDQNLRRILDLIGDEKSGNTYTIQKTEDVPRTDAAALRAWTETKEFDRDSFDSIFLRTIWIHEYDEIPKILRACVDKA